MSLRKTFTLINATLKSFIRNWSSIMMLIVFPLLLILLLFFAFNPDGLQKIPIGVVGGYADFDMNKYSSEYFPYLKISTYDNLDSCMNGIKIHKEYLCLEIKQQSPIIVNVYYDNTQSVVIWEILDRIKSSIDYLQKQKSKESVSNFLVEFGAALDKLETFKEQVAVTNNQIDSYIGGVDSTIVKLSNAKSDLSTTINNMDRDINDVKTTRNSLKSEKDNMYSGIMSYINTYESTLNQAGIQYDIGARGYVANENSKIDSKFYEMDSRIATYETASAQGKQYINDMSDGMVALGQVKTELINHKAALTKSYADINSIQGEFQGINTLNPELLVNPVVVMNIPAYVPKTSYTGNGNVTVQEVVKGINMLSLQTLFPTMLFLITLFLALLISSFIALSDINSSSLKRVNLIKNIAFHNILSVYLSSLIIIAVPVFCVLLMGSSLFQLSIFANGWAILAILFMVSSIFIILGMLIAQIIRKESITLLTTTFLLILFIFLSGFILPTEKMSDVVGAMSNYFPGKIGNNAFIKVVFYDQGISTIGGEFQLLLAWLLVLTILLIFVYHYRNRCK